MSTPNERMAAMAAQLNQMPVKSSKGRSARSRVVNFLQGTRDMFSGSPEENKQAFDKSVKRTRKENIAMLQLKEDVRKERLRRQAYEKNFLTQATTECTEGLLRNDLEFGRMLSAGGSAATQLWKQRFFENFGRNLPRNDGTQDEYADDVAPAEPELLGMVPYFREDESGNVIEVYRRPSDIGGEQECSCDNSPITSSECPGAKVGETSGLTISSKPNCGTPQSTCSTQGCSKLSPPPRGVEAATEAAPATPSTPKTTGTVEAGAGASTSAASPCEGEGEVSFEEYGPQPDPRQSPFFQMVNQFIKMMDVVKKRRDGGIVTDENSKCNKIVDDLHKDENLGLLIDFEYSRGSPYKFPQFIEALFRFIEKIPKHEEGLYRETPNAQNLKITMDRICRYVDCAVKRNGKSSAKGVPGLPATLAKRLGKAKGPKLGTDKDVPASYVGDIYSANGQFFWIWMILAPLHNDYKPTPERIARAQAAFENYKPGEGYTWDTWVEIRGGVDRCQMVELANRWHKGNFTRQERNLMASVLKQTLTNVFPLAENIQDYIIDTQLEAPCKTVEMVKRFFDSETAHPTTMLTSRFILHLKTEFRKPFIGKSMNSVDAIATCASLAILPKLQENFSALDPSALLKKGKLTMGEIHMMKEAAENTSCLRSALFAVLFEDLELQRVFNKWVTYGKMTHRETDEAFSERLRQREAWRQDLYEKARQNKEAREQARTEWDVATRDGTAAADLERAQSHANCAKPDCSKPACQAKIAAKPYPLTPYGIISPNCPYWRKALTEEDIANGAGPCRLGQEGTCIDCQKFQYAFYKMDQFQPEKHAQAYLENYRNIADKVPARAATLVEREEANRLADEKRAQQLNAAWQGMGFCGDCYDGACASEHTPAFDTTKYPETAGMIVPESEAGGCQIDPRTGERVPQGYYAPPTARP